MRALVPENVNMVGAGVMVPQVSSLSTIGTVWTTESGGNVTRPVSFTVAVTASSRALVSARIEIEPEIVSCAPACTTVRCMVPLRLNITKPSSVEAVIFSGPRWAGIVSEKDAPLWRSMPRAGGMGTRRMSRVDVFRMIKRRVKTVGLGEANCHTFRATGITAYLLNGGTLERAQAIAGHESPRTTKLYDRTADEVTIEDIEKIGI